MSQRGLLYRFWMGIPDWVFRALGVAFFVLLIGQEVLDFIARVQKQGGVKEAFLTFGAWYRVGNAQPTLYVPWGRLLYILTYVLIGLSFIIRMPPLKRASRAREIIIPVIGAFWPFLPFVVKLLLDLAGAHGLRDRVSDEMFDAHLSLTRFICGSGLIILGHALDVWGYAVLCRSLSIVAEARELKVTGPYRFVRHPVYLGQMMAQAGVWLFYAVPNPVWWIFYGCFVAMQLYRSKVEDDVLENAFGDRYIEWKRRTPWVI